MIEKVAWLGGKIQQNHVREEPLLKQNNQLLLKLQLHSQKKLESNLLIFILVLYSNLVVEKNNLLIKKKTDKIIIRNNINNKILFREKKK